MKKMGLVVAVSLSLAWTPARAQDDPQAKQALASFARAWEKAKAGIAAVLGCGETLPADMVAIELGVAKTVPGGAKLQKLLGWTGKGVADAIKGAGVCATQVLRGAICALPGKVQTLVTGGEIAMSVVRWMGRSLSKIWKWFTRKDKSAAPEAPLTLRKLIRDSAILIRDSAARIASKVSGCWGGFKGWLLERAAKPLETFKAVGKWLCEKGGEMLVDWTLSAATSGISRVTWAAKIAEAIGLLGSIPEVADVLKSAGIETAKLAWQACSEGIK